MRCVGRGPMAFLYILFYLVIFITIALPTALFYGWPFLFVWRAHVSTSRRHSIFMLILALAPFLFYGARYLYSYVTLKHSRPKNLRRRCAGTTCRERSIRRDLCRVGSRLPAPGQRAGSELRQISK